jgi:choline dehydrogenase-like flavoprotein
MFIDARTIPNDQVLQTDVCIVGAGAAGITLAREFAGQPFQVALLESGGLDADTDTSALTSGELTGVPYYPLQSTRLRFFGGTTNHWGGTCRPFDETDFERRDWIPNSGWPIRKSDLQPYYERAAKICHVGAPGDWGEDLWQKQAKYPTWPLADDRLISRVAQIVPVDQRSFGRNYRREVEQAQNVTTYLNANVLEIQTDDAGQMVTQVHVACFSGTKFFVQAKQFILAVGGIENARLLLLSNSRFPNGLGNQHDLVGRFFLEHPRFRGAVIVPTDRRIPVKSYEPHRVKGTQLKVYVSLSAEALRKEQLVDVQMNLDPVYDERYVNALDSQAVDSFKYLVESAQDAEQPTNLGQHLSNVMSDLLSWREKFVPLAPLPALKPEVISLIMHSPPAERERVILDYLGSIGLFAYDETIGTIPFDHVDVTTRIEPVPNPDSRITLGSERDRLGQPHARLDWQLHPLDKHSVTRTLEIMGAALGRAGIGRLQIVNDENATTWPEDIRGGWHHMGTTRMSDDPKHGVVDKHCQVHGLSNLFIAGSSVFPTAGSGTPTMTLVSLALRLADTIKERMR